MTNTQKEVTHVFLCACNYNFIEILKKIRHPFNSFDLLIGSQTSLLLLFSALVPSVSQDEFTFDETSMKLMAKECPHQL